jgi:3-dehydroquinate synthase
VEKVIMLAQRGAALPMSAARYSEISPAGGRSVNGAYLQQFSVAYEFPVIFTSGLFSPDNRVLVDVLDRIESNKRHRLMVFIDQGVLGSNPDIVHALRLYADAHPNKIELVCPLVPLPGGEGSKQGLDHVIEMQRTMVEYHMDRHSFVLAIGGGALLDAVGLAAATAHRGIRHIRIPTTVLSQNDSGVGVKNGVNLFGQKNFFGTFCPPFAVLNDIDLLEKLPHRDKRAGMAEAIKVALIRDKDFFAWLERSAPQLAVFERGAMAYMIQRCAELHMRQIGQGGDPFEAGAARPLDFGHWAAHRLELLSRFEVRHGEAVAVGIALDTEYSMLSGLLERDEADRVWRLLEALGFTLWHSELEAGHSQDHPLLQGLRDFREHLGGELTVTLLRRLGVGIEVHEINESLMLQALANLRTRHQS